MVKRQDLIEELLRLEEMLREQKNELSALRVHVTEIEDRNAESAETVNSLSHKMDGLGDAQKNMTEILRDVLDNTERADYVVDGIQNIMSYTGAPQKRGR